ncbi:MAG: hypothetical protein ACRENU_12355 [Gemmatimonadaceae bacterium]
MPWTRIRDAAVAGALAGLAAGLVFATAHAFVIEPIWDRMFGGLFGAAVTGAIVAWGYLETNPEAGARSGMRFGALLWLAVAPVSLVDVGLRLTTGSEPPQLMGDALAVVLALSAGALWGWLATHRVRGTLAVTAATLVLTMAMGGPVPIGRNVWAFGIWLAVLPASIVAGAVLGTALGTRQRAPMMAP